MGHRDIAGGSGLLGVGLEAVPQPHRGLMHSVGFTFKPVNTTGVHYLSHSARSFPHQDRLQPLPWLTVNRSALNYFC